jgi:putative transposase
MMNDYESLNHTKWECKYHVVFIPKYRRKALYGSLRKHLGRLFRELARQKECEIGEGHLMVDHVHMLISIPPKYSVSQVVGYMKGKSAIHIARTYGGKRRNFVGQHFWCAGLLGIDGGPQRGRRPEVYPRAGEGGSTPRSVGTVRGPKPL